MRNNERIISRRELLRGAAGVAAFTIVPRHVLGGEGTKPPSGKLNIAAVGVGGMGRTNVDACKEENIVALCDVDDEKAADTFNNYPGAKKYKDFRVMLEKEKGIDAVIVATPDHTHAVIAMAAMKMGKHVYVQKPMTWSIAEARALAKAARDAKVATQMGNQGQSDENIRLVVEWIQAGAIGQVREVHLWTNRPGGEWAWPQAIARPKDTPAAPANMDWDLWLGPAPSRPYHPAYHPSKWRGWRDFGTGPLGDMGCHIFNQPVWALNLDAPISVEACTTALVHSAEAMAETYPLASMVTYQFPAKGDRPAVKLVWYDGGLKPPRPDELEEGRKMPEDTGVLFIGDKGKLFEGRLIPESRMNEFERPAKTLARINGTHEQNWIEACKGGPAASSNFDLAGPMTETVLLGTIAVRTGQKIYWDPANMKITNSAEANELVGRKYREGWTL
jgi:predicted dehydrogenase